MILIDAPPMRRGILRCRSAITAALAELSRPPARQISFLDGLRTIAILLLVSGHFSHDFTVVNGPTAYSRLPFVMNGWIGVDLFFVLSGFFMPMVPIPLTRDDSTSRQTSFLVAGGKYVQ